jgi:hypothetical protein
LRGGQGGGRLPRARVALTLRPFAGLAHELTQLGENRRRTCTFALERFDPLQPGQNRTRLVDVPSVGGEQ